MGGMMLAKLKLLSAILLAASILVAGAGLLAWPGPDPQPAEQRAEDQPPSVTVSPKLQIRRDQAGDPLPEGAIARLGTMRLRDEGGWWTDHAVSPDGKTLATQDSGGVIRLWGLNTGKLLWSVRLQLVPGHLIFLADGKQLMSKDERSVCMLDAATGRLLRRIPTKDHVRAISPDGKLFVTGSNDGTARLWEIETGRQVSELQGHKTEFHHAAFTNGGRMLITVDREKICHWDVAEGKLWKTLDLVVPRPRTDRLSPDGRTLAVTPYSGEAVRLYDTDTGKLRCVLQGDPAAGRYGLAFTPDSRTLATDWAEPWADQATISLWDASNGKPLRRFTIPAGQSDNLSLAPDGRTVVTKGEPTWHLWDSFTGKPILTWPAHSGPIYALAFTPDGRYLVSCDGQELRLWEIPSGRHLRELYHQIEHLGPFRLAITPDGQYVLAGGYMLLRLYELRTGTERRRFLLDDHPEKLPKPTSGLPGHMVQRLGLSTDGRTAACISRAPHRLQPNQLASEVRLWDIATGRLLVRRETETWIHLIDLTPGATATIEDRGAPPPAMPANAPDLPGSNRIVLRDLRTGRDLLTLPQPDYLRFLCAVSPDGRTLVTATAPATQTEKETRWGPPTLRFWELASGKERMTITMPQGGWSFRFQELAFAPDGRTLATSRGDRTLQLWDVVSGRELLRRSGFDAGVLTLAFAPDGQILATGHTDSTILLWDTAAPKTSAERSSRERGAKELEQWLSALAGDDAPAAWNAIWKLIAAPRQVLPLLRQRLKPIEAFPVDEAGRLIDDLDSNAFAKREAASKRLAELEERVVPALKTALEVASSPEKRRRIERLLPTSEVVRSRDVLQTVRAIEVLEHIGTPEAQQVLKTLAQGMPEARVTREASAALERLAQQPAGKR
jgi:WD40 repeat protein